MMSNLFHIHPFPTTRLLDHPLDLSSSLLPDIQRSIFTHGFVIVSMFVDKLLKPCEFRCGGMAFDWDRVRREMF